MRLAFAGIAVAILVLAIALLSGGGDDNSSNEKPAAQATATATATATAGETAAPGATETPTPARQRAVDPGPLLTGEKVVKIEVNKGDTVRFRARSPQDDEVHVHGYDLKKDLPANQTVSMSFKATIDGIFEIEFEEQGKQTAELRVDP
jgi:plastocyanin